MVCRQTQEAILEDRIRELKDQLIRKEGLVETLQQELKVYKTSQLMSTSEQASTRTGWEGCGLYG